MSERKSLGKSTQGSNDLEFAMNHEGRLGYIEGKMESFATKEDIQSTKVEIQSLRTEISNLKPDIELAVQTQLTSQTKWIVGAILVPTLCAVIGWVLWGIEFFSKNGS